MTCLVNACASTVMMQLLHPEELNESCTVLTGNSVQFAGIIASHEQVKMSGQMSFDGFIVIEDAVDCATGHSRSGNPAYFDFSGNPEIHYDCVNPPNPWASKVSMQSWQEVQ